MTNASTEVAKQPQVQDSRVENETRPGSLTGILFILATNLTNVNQPAKDHAQYSVHPNATQPQAEPTNPVSMMSQQGATSEPNSCFTVPSNHVLPNVSAWTIPTTGCAVPFVAIAQLALQGLFRAPNTNSDNNTMAPHVIPVTSGGTVYYLNPSSGPNLVGGPMPNNVCSTAPMSVGGPKVVPIVSIATPRTEPNAFTTVQNLAQLLACSRKDHLTEWKLAKYNADPSQSTSVSASLTVPLTQFH